LEFYGDSMLISPSGEIISMLEDKESMLIGTNNKKKCKRATRNLNWGILKKLKP